jgi:hypothetical protein
MAGSWSLAVFPETPGTGVVGARSRDDAVLDFDFDSDGCGCGSRTEVRRRDPGRVSGNRTIRVILSGAGAKLDRPALLPASDWLGPVWSSGTMNIADRSIMAAILVALAAAASSWWLEPLSLLGDPSRRRLS